MREHEELWAQEMAANEARMRAQREALEPFVRQFDAASAPARVAEAEAAPVKTGRQPNPRRAMWHVALGALVVAVMIVGTPHVSGVIGWGKGLFAQPGPTTVGTAVAVDATTFHPDVEVFAGAPVDVPAPAGARVAKGQHLVAVPLRLANKGLVRWDIAAASKTTVVDDLGTAKSVAKGVSAVKGRPLLPAQLKIAPGTSVTGYVVFSVPNGRTVRSVDLALGQDGDEVTWKVGS
jgi:hypothetical protein